MTVVRSAPRRCGGLVRVDSGRGAYALAAALVAPLALAACAAAGPVVSAGSDDTPASDTPATVTAVTAAPRAPGELVVVDPLPAGADVQQVQARPDAPGPQPLLAGATLYAQDATGFDGEPFDGPTILVGSSQGAGIGGPRTDVAGAHVVDVPLDEALGGLPATFVPGDDRDWVVVPLGQDWIGFVIGRGVTEDELVAAARGADFLGAPARVDPAALPAGFRVLVAGDPGDGPGWFWGERLTLELDGVRVTVHAAEADPALAVLWSAWVATTEPRADGRHAGPLVGNALGPEAYGVVWSTQVDGTDLVVAVLGSPSGPGAGDVAAAVEQVAGAVRPGSAGELAALAELTLGPPTAEEIGCRAGSPVVSGRDGARRWAYAVEIGPDGRASSCSAAYTSGDAAHGDTLGSVGVPPPDGLYGQCLTSVEAELADVLCGGLVPAAAARVEVTSAQGVGTDAVVSDELTVTGHRVFGCFLGDRPFDGAPARYRISVYDAAGALLVEGDAS